jgi:hypothetical protein
MTIFLGSQVGCWKRCRQSVAELKRSAARGVQHMKTGRGRKKAVREFTNGQWVLIVAIIGGLMLLVIFLFWISGHIPFEMD